MKQKHFIDEVVRRIKNDEDVVGLGVAGSFTSNEVDEFSDVDLILVTNKKITPDLEKMVSYARSFGDYLNGFTGEHVGDPRVLICLYDNPLLHVDIKFITLDEFEHRVEDPIIVFDREKALENVIASTESSWPKPDYQWIEDRFWTWVHYATLKLGRGENFEALDFLSFMRVTVTAPLLQIKNGRLPRGLRKVELNLNNQDLKQLIDTVAQYDVNSIFISLENTIRLYQELRLAVFPTTIILREQVEKKTLTFLQDVKHDRLRQG